MSQQYLKMPCLFDACKPDLNNAYKVWLIYLANIYSYSKSKTA